MALAYLGISLPNQIKNPLRDQLGQYSNQELLQSKLSHDEYSLLLDGLKIFDFVKELALITTCNRFELLVIIEDGQDSQVNINKLRGAISSVNKSEIVLDYLKDDDAKLQFLRTYCGLNSGLVGEDEICMQIGIAFKQCFHMEYLGKQGIQLLRDAQALRSTIDEYIYQERVSYCTVAIESALKHFGTNHFSNIVIAGSGSTAHQSSLSLVKLKQDPNKFTLAHRISSSSSQISNIKASTVLEGMSYLRCKHGYHSQKMKDLIQDADLVIFGIDSRLPSIHFTKHNKTPVIDFSSKPSLSFDDDASKINYLSSPQLDQYVRNYSERRMNQIGFMAKIELAEALIAKSLETTNYASSFKTSSYQDA
ncbi:MAG: hypothetical protein O3C63_08115 [Cyanobacteria bacterium]|nr:hypothetical protein [Cyanobacteriota bacterium]MDA1020095.1 hypothetical protein [Cyanobacteriota bacterium]